MHVSLCSAHGKYLTAELDGTVNATRDYATPGPWETWTHEALGAAACALKSHHGGYLCAEGGGGSGVTASRMYDSPGPWETFTAIPHESGGYALRCHDGVHYLCAELDGTLVANRTAIGEWEIWRFEPDPFAVEPAPPPNEALLKGVLHLKGRQMSDDTGPVALIGKHYGSAFSDWVHGRQDEVRMNLDAIVGAGYQAIRTFTVLGYWDTNRPDETSKELMVVPYLGPVPRNHWVAWKDREVTPYAFTGYSGRPIPATPDYYGQKQAFLEELQTRGLKFLDDRGDLNAWTTAQKLEHCRDCGRQYAQLSWGRDVLGGFWACNESWQNGVPDVEQAKQMIHAFKEGATWWPDVRGLSAPHSLEETPDLLEWSEPPATVITIHGNRTVNEFIVHHYFGYGYDAALRESNRHPLNTEPIGSGSSVGSIDDLELLLTVSTAARMTGQGWVQMSGEGVWAYKPLANSLGFRETAALSHRFDKDLSSFETVCHSGDTWRGTRIFATQYPTDTKHTRADTAIANDGRFYCLINKNGDARAVESVPCERACDYDMIDLTTDTVVQSGHLNPGDRLQMPHYRYSRLLRGRLT